MRPRIVGVILSRADLERALRLRRMPDVFELRLDGLVGCINHLRRVVGRLGAPIIITARHPREGGSNQVSPGQRRMLLLEFLPVAEYVDVELRSARFLGSVLRAAHRRKLSTIISFHDLRHTPSAARLDQIASAARSLGADIVKIATRTDSISQMDRLLGFFKRRQEGLKIVAMGIGKLGKICRRELFRSGCPLNYAPLGRPQVPGQLSLAELRRLQ